MPKDFPAISKIIEFSERSHLEKDAEIDAGKDAGKEAEIDIGKDAGKDAGKDVGTDAKIDSGKSAKSPLSILGICLGHQAIVEYFGGTLRKLESPLHGAVSNLELVQPDSIFNGISDGVQVAHYHSWVADSVNLPDSLKVLAKSSIVNCRNLQGNMNNKSSLREEGNNQGDGQIVDIIMAVRHKSYNIWGLQFHPESVVSESGREILQNWLNITR